ncbi:MAG: hypothetical protein JST51_15515 [Armatimonadetes bacterium]|nr:hypothetical protein [Armatimonadota bacterium]
MIPLLAPSYTVTDLHFAAQSAIMSETGIIAGKMYSTDRGSTEAFVWRHGKLTKLPTIREIYAINASGQMAVQSDKGYGLWNNGIVTLHSPGDTVGQPAGISDEGQITEIVSTGSEGMYNISVWPRTNPVAHSFEVRPRPGAVAPDGSIAGTHGYGLQFRLHDRPLGWLWVAGVKERPIGTAQQQAVPTCISRGHRVGGTFTMPGSVLPLPFDWADGNFRALPVPAGNSSTGHVVGINDRNECVGWCDWQQKIPNGIANVVHGFLWRAGIAYDLNDLIPADANLEIIGALGVSAKGEILASAKSRAYGWPTTLVILKPT